MKKLVLLALVFVGMPAMANRESGGRQSAASVIVDFTSQGEGIDSNAYNFATELLNQYAASGLVKLSWVKPYGREGENLLCAEFQGGQFGGIDTSRNYISGIAPVILSDTRARTGVYLGFSCDRPEQSTLQDLRKYVN